MLGYSQEELDQMFATAPADEMDEIYLWSSGDVNSSCGWQKIGAYNPYGGICPEQEPGVAGMLKASIAFSLREILRSGLRSGSAGKYPVSPASRSRARRRHATSMVLGTTSPAA